MRWKQFETSLEQPVEIDKNVPLAKVVQDTVYERDDCCQWVGDDVTWNAFEMSDEYGRQ